MAAKYWRYSDIAQGTWTLAAGSANSVYPVTDLGLLLPFSPKPFKATSGTCTPRLTTGSAVTGVGVAIAGHNLAGVTVTITNGAGLSTTLTLPANTLDGLWTNGFKSLAGLSNPSSTQWNFAISGASANVAINKILLLTNLRTWNVRWGVKAGLHYPSDVVMTELGAKHVYEQGVRSRPVIGTMNQEADREAMEQLFADARGESRVWGAVLDDSVNDCHILRFTKDTFIPERRTPGTVTMTIEAEELGLGQAL